MGKLKASDFAKAAREPEHLQPNLLPVFNEDRTRLSIKLWNIGKESREALKPRERAEARRRLIKAARKFNIDLKVER